MTTLSIRRAWLVYRWDLLGAATLVAFIAASFYAASTISALLRAP